ncbi:hypothetical protein KFE25_010379 [Diacronema lutheri]|mgnify:CR=1 FL=1|uniref:Endoplasmic reticulum transmembrane protein n=1 Tax=Diacronema lutheri TaxID=2081491 RepID=A0A8J5XDP9_DIALT|nr:hypothetical protein KFE25_010379 [Diacronema lutheri]|mmetsp:Transcript_3380/g.10552  ORF Transcript_3380/g.10552 Transcript_3380/m.10552 type:complete len:147 (-) Transcript_3380:264-704(-)
MDPGWLVVTLALLTQCSLVLLLVLPVPSNAVRGAILRLVHAIWGAQFVRFTVVLVMAIDVVYLWFTLHVMGRQGSLFSPVDTARTEMEEIALYRDERNAFITAGNLFLFLVLRRLVDIQDQLRRARIASKGHDKVEQVINETKKAR